MLAAECRARARAETGRVVFQIRLQTIILQSKQQRSAQTAARATNSSHNSTISHNPPISACFLDSAENQISFRVFGEQLSKEFVRIFVGLTAAWDRERVSKQIKTDYLTRDLELLPKVSEALRLDIPRTGAREIEYSRKKRRSRPEEPEESSGAKRHLHPPHSSASSVNIVQCHRKGKGNATVQKVPLGIGIKGKIHH